MGEIWGNQEISKRKFYTQIGKTAQPSMVDFLKEQADTAEVRAVVEKEDGIRSEDGLMVALNC